MIHHPRRLSLLELLRYLIQWLAWSGERGLEVIYINLSYLLESAVFSDSIQNPFKTRLRSHELGASEDGENAPDEVERKRRSPRFRRKCRWIQTLATSTLPGRRKGKRRRRRLWLDFGSSIKYSSIQFLASEINPPVNHKQLYNSTVSIWYGVDSGHGECLMFWTLGILGKHVLTEYNFLEIYSVFAVAAIVLPSLALVCTRAFR